MDSVSAEVNGPLTASVAVDNLYVGGGFGGGTLPDPITVTFGENAALNAENTRHCNAGKGRQCRYLRNYGV